MKVRALCLIHISMGPFTHSGLIVSIGMQKKIISSQLPSCISLVMSLACSHDRVHRREVRNHRIRSLNLGTK